MEHLIFKEIREGNLDGVKSILNDSTKNITSEKNVGLLSYSIVTAQREIFDYLLEELNNDEIMSGLYNPVDLAIQYKEHNFLEKLLQSGKVDNNYNSVYLINAYQLNADQKTLEILNKAGYSLDKPVYAENGHSVFNTLLSTKGTENIVLNLDDNDLNKLINFDSFILFSNNTLPEKETLDKMLSFKGKISDEEKGLLFKSAMNQGNIILISEMMNMPGFYPTNDQVLELLKTTISFKTPRNDYEKRANEEIEKIFLTNNIPFYEYSEKFGISILSDCIQNGKNNLLSHFIELGADIDERASNNRYSNNQTPLHYAINHNNIFAIDKLLDNKASTTIQDANGNTGLHYAVKSGNQEIFEKLLDKGSSYIDSVNNEGETPIAIAIREMDKYMISKLLWKGANLFRVDLFKDNNDNLETINTNNQYQSTIIEREKKQLNTFSELVNYNFNIYQMNKDGDTFAHSFIKTGNIKNLKAFLDIGYNLNAVNTYGNNILMTAVNSSDSFFNLVCDNIEKTPNYQFFTKNQDGQDIYDLLLAKKDVKRLTRVLLAEMKSEDRIKQLNTSESLLKVLPFIAMHGNLYELSPELEEMILNGKTRLLDKKGNPLLMFSMMSKNYENMEFICLNKPEQIITPTTIGKSPIEMLEGIKDKDPKNFNKMKDIFISYISEEILESLNIPDIRKKNFIDSDKTAEEDSSNNIEINKNNINQQTKNIINKIRYK